MMTLDEAIKHAEEVAEENQRIVDTGIVFDDVTIDMLYCDDTEVIEEHLANYRECAEQHRQLAEWLKDYKRLKEQQSSEDCVSRQVVIDYLHTNMAWYDENGSIADDSQKLRDITNLVNGIPSVVPTQKWIPVSERLPESSGVYIVSRWFSDGEERAILVDANYYDGDGYWYNDNRINWGRDLVTNRILAWMPLPEPYKAEMESEV